VKLVKNYYSTVDSVVLTHSDMLLMPKALRDFLGMRQKSGSGKTDR